MKPYPSWRYHRTETPRVVHSAIEDELLGSEWADSPAAHGIETAPGRDPDPAIARRRAALLEPESPAEPEDAAAMKTETPRVVHSAIEDELLGSEWASTPAAVLEPEPVPEPLAEESVPKRRKAK
jgi:hypothetical protein